ncbi:hypothetical protein ACWCYY_37990 [Kitasatospora sp. NPDC001664]
MRLRHASVLLLAAALLTACTSTSAAPDAATSQPAAPPSPPASPSPSPSPTVVTTPSAALQDVAAALGDQGRGGPFTDVFGSLVLNGPGNTVTLYSTDERRASALITAAKVAQPEIDTTLVRVVKCPYSRKQIDAVMDRIMDRSQAGALPFTVQEASMEYDASGIKVGVEPAGVDSPELRQALTHLTDGIPVTVSPARPGSDLLGGHP